MPADHSTKPAKPSKPYPEYPLTAHPAGYWCKKIRGKLHYFGPWNDPDGALAKYLDQKEALHAGRKPRPDPTALTVKEAVNNFLNFKKQLVETGELSPRTFACYKEAADAVIACFGKTRLVADLDPEDFATLRNKLAKRYGPHGLGTRIQCVRCIFRYAFKSGKIAREVSFGEDFKKPSKKTLRLHRAKQGSKLFTAEEIRRLIDQATPQHKAMLLLGINAGFGNHDCAALPLTALDLDGGWIDFPRPKTGLPRRCPLWPETVAALRDVLACRKEPKDPANAGLVFVTRTGQAWAKGKAENPLSDMTAKLVRKLGINGHRNFYTLRHTFRTVADEAKDQPAADFIMGHEVAHMSSVYRERIGDERLKAVADHVRAWLFPAEGGAAAAKEAPADLESRGQAEAQ